MYDVKQFLIIGLVYNYVHNSNDLFYSENLTEMTAYY